HHHRPCGGAERARRQAGHPPGRAGYAAGWRDGARGGGVVLHPRARRRGGPLRVERMTAAARRAADWGHGTLPRLPTPFRRADTMAMPAPLYYTAEMVLALPDDGNRYETVHGELLVTPSPRALHQLALERVVLALAEYLRREPVGALWFAPADISWSPDTLVQPDCFVVPLDEARTLDWARMKTLLLAVEVLSPSTARADRFTKRRLYQEQRIPTYWIVD